MRRILTSVLLAAALVACGGTQMNTVGEAPVVRQGESMMVFMRASQLGGLVSASVFDITSSETKFVGLVNYGTKLAHPLKPGQYTFMVVGESADFMEAEIAAGKTYYALVIARPGAWKARFSFVPVRDNEKRVGEWERTLRVVESTPKSEAWAKQNAPSIESKRSKYYDAWISKPESQRAGQTLNAEDGRQ